MAAEAITPVEEYSGLPYPIAPRVEQVPLGRSDIANEHHGWHPRYHPSLQTLAGVALRNSWIQYVHKELHNFGSLSYHSYYKGPELPTDETDIYGRVILAFAGYIPDGVIDMTSKSLPFVRGANEQEIALLHQPRQDSNFCYQYLRYGYDPIRDFLLEHTLRQDMSHINESIIDEFIYTPVDQRKNAIGEFLLWSAAEIATDDIRQKYRDLAKKHLLHPMMPKDPKPLVKWKLGSEKHMHQQVIPKLEAMFGVI